MTCLIVLQPSDAIPLANDDTVDWCSCIEQGRKQMAFEKRLLPIVLSQLMHFKYVCPDAQTRRVHDMLSIFRILFLYFITFNSSVHFGLMSNFIDTLCRSYGIFLEGIIDTSLVTTYFNYFRFLFYTSKDRKKYRRDHDPDPTWSTMGLMLHSTPSLYSCSS